MLLVGIIGLVTPAKAVTTNFSVNTTNTNPNYTWIFVVCSQSLPSPVPAPTGTSTIPILPQNCYYAQACGASCGPFNAGAGTTIYLIAPLTVAGPTGTLYFQGWAGQQGTLCISTSCNLPANSPIITTNSTYYLTTQTGSWNLLAIYGTTPLAPSGGCTDPFNVGWTGRTIGCTFGLSNAYFVGIAVVLGLSPLFFMKKSRSNSSKGG